MAAPIARLARRRLCLDRAAASVDGVSGAAERVPRGGPEPMDVASLRALAAAVARRPCSPTEVRGANAMVKLRVRATTSIRPSRRDVINGEYVIEREMDAKNATHHLDVRLRAALRLQMRQQGLAGYRLGAIRIRHDLIAPSTAWKRQCAGTRSRRSARNTHGGVERGVAEEVPRCADAAVRPPMPAPGNSGLGTGRIAAAPPWRRRPRRRTEAAGWRRGAQCRRWRAGGRARRARRRWRAMRARGGRVLSAGTSR